MNEHSFNINLLIPFKDNKGDRLNLYKREIESFKSALEGRVETIKESIEEKIQRSEITILARSDGNSKKYYWRFKSSARDRKYNRLNSEPVIQYLQTLQHEIIAWLVEIEEELIYINANLKLVKGMLDSIDQVASERQNLLEINIHSFSSKP